ncbi:hypothetical protein PLESTF_001662500 [Pleodorina starrii]|nr:hypothetical protein PLESTF_001662500 [Pleodorina starrii]
MPERSEVHGFAWAEDLDAPNRSQDGRMLMGVDPNAWQPRLRLETPRGWVVHSQPVTEVVKDPRVTSSLRPFHFTFPLELKLSGRCFKLFEESFPGHRASFCLPTTSQRLCRRLVSEAAAAEGSPPALWSVVFPPRGIGVNGTHWEYHSRLGANRLFNYAVYQIGIGGAGVLVYVDRMTRAGLERVPRIAGLMSRGRLMLALVASHALLGTSSCGPQVMLLLGDMDEYLYSAYGHGWPSIYACLNNTDPRATLHRIQRSDVASTRLEPNREVAWWVLPARSLSRHPILAYDRLHREAMPPERGKVLALPSGRVLGFYVHDGVPMYGTSRVASGQCCFLLHIPNYWGPRSGAAAASGGGGVDSLDLLFDLDGGGGGAATATAAGGGGGAAAAAAAGAPGGAAVARSRDYTPFRVSATWAVGPAATTALDAGSAVGGGGGGRRRGGRVRGGAGSWRVSDVVDDDDLDDGGGSGGNGGGEGAVSAGTAAAAAVTALAAANAAAAVLAAAATMPTKNTTAQAGGGGVAGSGADAGSKIAADADRLAALAAQKVKTGQVKETKPAGVAGAEKDAAAAVTAAAGSPGDPAVSGGSGFLPKWLDNIDTAAGGGAAAGGGGGQRGGDSLAFIRAAKQNFGGGPGDGKGHRRLATGNAGGSSGSGSGSG